MVIDKVRAKKYLGQNFLINPNIAEMMSKQIQGKDRTVLEIGSGTGSLTKSLLHNTNVKLIVGIEKDLGLKPILEDLKEENAGKIDFIYSDALHIDFAGLHNKYCNHLSSGKLTLIGNLPYNVGTLIVMKALQNITLFDKILVMLQQEVVDRFTSVPRCGSYGRISVIAQALCNVKQIASVSPENFRPRPQIQSAIVEFTPLPILPEQRIMKILSRICKIGFGQRRKKLLTTLKSLQDAELYQFIADRVSKDARIEELSPLDLLDICGQISKEFDW